MRVRWGFRLALIIAAATLIAEMNSRAGQPIAGPAMAAPEIQSSVWINGEPISLTALRGKVVLVEFWTYG